MILNNEAERCRQAYQKHFEETLKSSNSLEQAVDSCAHLFLDGKPVKKGFTTQVRSSALWQCHFWRTLPDAIYSSDVVAFALGRSLHNGCEDVTLFKDLLHKAPETLKRGVRYSQIFLKPDSPPWKQILSLPNNGNKDFLDFLTVCHQLHAELCASDKAVADLQRQLDDLTIFEYLLYASLFTFQNLVPERFHLSMIDDEWVELHQSAWDALSELLMWKLKTRDEKDLKLNERFLAKSLKRHLIPLLLPGEGAPAIQGSPLHRVVQWFKTMSTNEYIRGVKQNGWAPFPGKLWQRNYWEHIVRNESELNRIREYIQTNPAQWALEKLFVGAVPCGCPNDGNGQAQGPAPTEIREPLTEYGVEAWMI